MRNLTPMILNVFIYLLNLPTCNWSVYHVGCLLNPRDCHLHSNCFFQGRRMGRKSGLIRGKEREWREGGRDQFHLKVSHLQIVKKKRGLTQREGFSCVSKRQVGKEMESDHYLTVCASCRKPKTPVNNNFKESYRGFSIDTVIMVEGILPLPQ